MEFWLLIHLIIQKVIRIEPPLMMSRAMVDTVLEAISTALEKANEMIEDL